MDFLDFLYRYRRLQPLKNKLRRTNTTCIARITKGVARHRDKLPVIACRVQGHFEYTPGRIVAHFAVSSDGGANGGSQKRAASADNELADAPLRVGLSSGRLRREPLI